MRTTCCFIAILMAGPASAQNYWYQPHNFRIMYPINVGPHQEAEVWNGDGLAEYCKWHNGVFPVAGEEGHMVAVALDPPGYPFTVTQVQHQMEYSPNYCNGGRAHAVEYWVTSAQDALPPSGASDGQIWVDEDPTQATNSRWVTVDMPDVVINYGEVIWLAIKLPTTDTCVAMCSGMAGVNDNYWSNAASPQYPWVDLASFGVEFQDDLMRISMTGTYF